jgi:glutaredoxin-like protein NrdH
MDKIMSVTLYSKPACTQCNQTKRDLQKYGISYTEIDVTVDEEAFNALKERGVQQMPAVETGDDFWTGYNRAKIKALAGA